MKVSFFFKKLRCFIGAAFPVLLVLGVCAVLFECTLSFAFSIAFPFLVVINLMQLLFFLVKQKKKFWLNVASLLIFFFFFDSFYQVNFKKDDKYSNDSIKILSYNAHWFKSNFNDIHFRDKKIVDFVLKYDPDIACFQEFSAIKYKFFIKHYPYWVKTNLMIPGDKSILAVFSKYPIISKGYIEFSDSMNTSMYVDINIDGDIIRVYNVHLESNRTNTVHQLNNINSYRPLINRVFEANKTRTMQAHLVREHAQGFHQRVVIAGDFNCTQYGSAYLVLKESKKDTFVEAGNGFGATYELFNYPFKIDHILVDETFEVISHKNFKVNLSDHEPVFAEIKW